MHYYYFADREDFATAAVSALGTTRVACVSHPSRITSEFEHDGDRYYAVVLLVLAAVLIGHGITGLS